jgi:hypothetical protein
MVRRGRGALTVFRHDQSLIPSPCQASAGIRQARHSLAALPRTTANVNEPYEEPDVWALIAASQHSPSSGRWLCGDVLLIRWRDGFPEVTITCAPVSVPEDGETPGVSV